jgi:ArsR family transcriptional regulator
MLQHPMPSEMLDAVAAKFRALSQAPRLRLLESLFDGPLTVNELAASAGLGQANTSKHLTVLAQAGFVTRARRGTQVVYGLADQMPKQLCSLLCGRVMSEVEDDLRRIRGG